MKYNFNKLRKILMQTKQKNLKCHTCKRSLFHQEECLDAVKEWLNNFNDKINIADFTAHIHK